MGRVQDKVVLITGAARGQGRSHATALAAEGADVILVDSCADIETNDYPLARPEDLDETVRLVEKEGRRAIAVIADVRDVKGLQEGVDDAVQQFGALDVVVANAGIAPLTKDLPAQAFLDAVGVNLIGAMNTVSVALAHLSPGASIIAIGSFAAFSGGTSAHGPGGAGYTFSKKALSHFMNDLSLQLAAQSIRANVVHPTNCNTDMLHSAPMYGVFRPDLQNPTRADAEVAFPSAHAIPVPYVEPEDISHAVVYLASDESRFVTGMQLRVDAGAFVKKYPWAQ